MQKYLKEMEHLVNVEESKAPPPVPRMMKKMHSAAMESVQSGRSKNMLHRSKVAVTSGNSPFMSTQDIIAKH